jgi:hypothetical protein
MSAFFAEGRLKRAPCPGRSLFEDEREGFACESIVYLAVPLLYLYLFCQIKQIAYFRH